MQTTLASDIPLGYFVWRSSLLPADKTDESSNELWFQIYRPLCPVGFKYCSRSLACIAESARCALACPTGSIYSIAEQTCVDNGQVSWAQSKLKRDSLTGNDFPITGPAQEQKEITAKGAHRTVAALVTQQLLSSACFSFEGMCKLGAA